NKTPQSLGSIIAPHDEAVARGQSELNSSTSKLPTNSAWWSRGWNRADKAAETADRDRRPSNKGTRPLRRVASIQSKASAPWGACAEAIQATTKPGWGIGGDGRPGSMVNASGMLTFRRSK